MRPRLIVRIGRGLVRMHITKAGTPIWAAEGRFATPTELAEALAGLAADIGIKPPVRVARVELERPLVQVRTLADLPPVRNTALMALVDNQAGRFFRKNGTPLVTAAAWHRTGRRASRIAVAAAIEEPWLEAIVTGLRTAGLTIDGISPAGSRLHLWPRNEHLRRARAARRQVAHLAVLTCLLWLVVAGIALGGAMGEQAAVERDLTRLRPTESAVVAARREYDQAQAMVEAIDKADRQRGAIAATVVAVLLALPDSAFVTTLRVTDHGQGELSGAAPRAIAVTAALERSGAVPAPRLVGSDTREVVGGREYERFTARFGPDSAR